MGRTMRASNLDSWGGAGVLAPPRPPASRTHERERGGPRPPRPPGDGGGDGGRGGGGDRGGDGARPDDRALAAARFALLLALIGISTMFLVLVAVWVLLRRGEPDPARDASFLPPDALWVSTLVLLASSAVIEGGARAARGGPSSVVARWLGGSLLLGLAFLAAQGVLWWSLVQRGLVPASGAYAAVLYAMTGLHALHVVGGLVAMAGAIVRLRGPLPPLGHAPMVRLCATYWHFMGAVWLALFAVLYFLW